MATAFQNVVVCAEGNIFVILKWKLWDLNPREDCAQNLDARGTFMTTFWIGRMHCQKTNYRHLRFMLGKLI